MDDDDGLTCDDWDSWMALEQTPACFTCGVLGRFRVFSKLVAWHLGRV